MNFVCSSSIDEFRGVAHTVNLLDFTFKRPFSSLVLLDLESVLIDPYIPRNALLAS